MKLDAIYEPNKDRIQISYQKTPNSPVTTIDIARGHEHHVINALEDFASMMGMEDGWEYHFRDADKNYPA